MNVKRPLLRHFGGKWQLRHWIIDHLPEHRFYAEPFAGAASVLLAKEPAAGGEIINDLNEEIINLFRVMRDEASSLRLRGLLEWTPYAAAELALSREASPEPVERARRTLVRSFMGIETAGTQGSCSGFRMGGVDLRRLDQSGKRTFRNCAKDWSNWRENMDAIRTRMSHVMIYQRDALEFIDMMDSGECLLYIDPPYHADTRSSAHPGTRYAHEFNPERHGELVERLTSLQAMAVVSGYPHESYDPLTKAGWSLVQKDYRANMSDSRRTECLWISPSAQKAGATTRQRTGISKEGM